MSKILSDALLPEFDREMANTRKVLERVPEDRPDFRPHPKSMSLARLAGHVAELPMWVSRAFASETIDLNPAGGARPAPYEMRTRAEALARFDDHVGRARQILAGATDEALATVWTLKNAGDTVFSMPRLAVLRGMVMNHIIHHRAQLGVYLRMNDVPLPGLYGPSADESAARR